MTLWAALCLYVCEQSKLPVNMKRVVSTEGHAVFLAGFLGRHMAGTSPGGTCD